ncbi:MAG TPA: glycerophosphoryl diester phosphodiesterase membrane domain-containing protein [Herpetosiphonaceae bacterium]
MLNRPRIRELSLGELLDTSFRLYRNNFLLFVKIAALVLVPYHLLSFLLTAPESPLQSSGSTTSLITSFLRSTSSPTDSGWLSLIYSVVVQPLLYGTLILLAAQCYQQQPVALGANFRHARQRLLTMIGADILQGLCIILAGLPAIFVAICGVRFIVDQRINAIFDASSPSETIPTILFILLGGLLLVLPLLVRVRLMFSTQAVMLEDQGAVASLDRSWKLTQQRMWRLVGFVLVVGLLEMCLTTLPVGAAVFGISMAGASDQLILALRVALDAISEIVVLPFTMIAYTLMFFDLRIRSEGFDLEQHDLLAPRPDDGEYQPSPSM